MKTRPNEITGNNNFTFRRMLDGQENKREEIAAEVMENHKDRMVWQANVLAIKLRYECLGLPNFQS